VVLRTLQLVRLRSRAAVRQNIVSHIDKHAGCFQPDAVR